MLNNVIRIFPLKSSYGSLCALAFKSAFHVHIIFCLSSSPLERTMVTFGLSKEGTTTNIVFLS